jgi:hypothetical protein
LAENKDFMWHDAGDSVNLPTLYNLFQDGTCEYCDFYE